MFLFDYFQFFKKLLPLILLKKVMVEVNQGELKISLNEGLKGKISLEELGIENNTIIEGGNLRLVIHLENIGAHHFFKVPTLEFVYNEKIGESQWQCEFNEATIVDKIDNSGHATLLLLKRDVLENLEHRHINELIVHADLPSDITLNTKASYIHLFE